MTDTLTSTKKEISRLVQNNKALFDILPDMLIIIKDDFIIEHMNTAAIAKMGDHHGKKCYQIIAGLDSPCETGTCPFKCQDPERNYGKMFEKKLNDSFYVESCYVPFKGYRHDNLNLLISRDITEKKLHEIELKNYNKNIEKILKKKIAALKANETERKELYQEVNHLKKETERFIGQEKMIGESKPIHALRERIYQVARKT